MLQSACCNLSSRTVWRLLVICSYKCSRILVLQEAWQISSIQVLFIQAIESSPIEDKIKSDALIYIFFVNEQNLIDCTTKYGNNGCNGGLALNAWKYVKTNGGIDTESAYAYTRMESRLMF
jgi:hypothetical protein